MTEPIKKREGARLPHWTADGATYAVTFRLADAIPTTAAQKLHAELESLEKTFERGGELTLTDQLRLARLRSETIDRLLNAGHGECMFNQAAAAEIVADALKFFDGERYRLLAWCVMPNHVHVVFTPMKGAELAKILHSWKSFTAKQINRKLAREGAVWQPESYDHLIRDRSDLMHHVYYVRENPAKAGLVDWHWVG